MYLGIVKNAMVKGAENVEQSFFSNVFKLVASVALIAGAVGAIQKAGAQDLRVAQAVWTSGVEANKQYTNQLRSGTAVSELYFWMGYPLSSSDSGILDEYPVHAFYGRHPNIQAFRTTSR